jgi:hypothetical protein
LSGVRKALAEGLTENASVPRKSPLVTSLRQHLGAELAAVSVALVTGAVLAFWRASRRTEADMDARTWARLVPPQPAADAPAEPSATRSSPPEEG